MRGKSIVPLLVLILCLAASSSWANLVFVNGGSHGVDFVGTHYVENSSLCRITTLNVLVGSIGITFSGWLLRKRKTS